MTNKNLNLVNSYGYIFVINTVANELLPGNHTIL